MTSANAWTLRVAGELQQVIVVRTANCMSHPISKLHVSAIGTLALARAATTSGIHGASVHSLKATTPLLFRPSAFKLSTRSPNSSTMSSNGARRTSLFVLLVAWPAVPIAAGTRGHEQD
jgi:hypothetical protein